MMLRNIVFVTGVLTLVAAAVLAVMWIRTPSSSAPKTPLAAGQPPAILVAAADIPAGAVLHSGDLRWQRVQPAAIVPTDLVRGQASEASYYGAVTRTPVSAGQPLRGSDVVLSSNRDFLAAALAPGMRAVSLAVDESQAVSGLIQPQDRVDIVLTRVTNQTNGATSAVGETVLRNVRVVAVDQWFGHGAKVAATDARFGSSPAATATSSAKEVTLELDDADAKRLLVATQLGRVSLVLRALASSGTTAAPIDQPVWEANVSTALGAAAQPTAPVQPAASATVEIIRGSKTATPGTTP
jgi:pilus assembly protein CpaB